MIDIKLIRESPDIVRDNLAKRQDAGIMKIFDDLLIEDEKIRKMKKEIDSLKSNRNKISIEISQLKKEKKDAEKKTFRGVKDS